MMSKRRVVLVVDDDEPLLHALQFSLELEGFDVRIFSSSDALLALEPFPEVGCLVVDQKLPGRTGLETIRALRARRIGLPAILITSNPNRAVRERAKANAVEIVEKPLLSDALAAKIRLVLERTS